jgi:NO-binding membrane sensor protein with MHYT domain
MIQAMMQAMIAWLAQYDLPLLCLALLVCSSGSYIVAVLLARAWRNSAAFRSR